MHKLISGYLWAWTNWQAGSKSLQTLRKYYPDSDIFVNVDYDGDVKNYKKICEENDYIFSRNSFQLGYCGNFGNINVGRDCWPMESSVEWMDRLYAACIKTDSKYIMLFEEDDFVLNPISLLNLEFSMAIHPTNPSPTGVYRSNHIPNEFLKIINENGGNTESPGYAAGGGTIFNREHMILSWEKTKPILIDKYDYLKSVNKIIGWQDYLMQFVMQLGGYEIIQNTKLAEHWEVGDRWNEFEIVTGMKDAEIIKKI
jgi:hypothetical protein